MYVPQLQSTIGLYGQLRVHSLEVQCKTTPHIICLFKCRNVTNLKKNNPNKVKPLFIKLSHRGYDNSLFK